MATGSKIATSSNLIIHSLILGDVSKAGSGVRQAIMVAP